MKTRIFALAVSAALVVACDPYEKAVGGTPAITSIISTQTGSLSGNSPAVNATLDSTGTWQLPLQTWCGRRCSVTKATTCTASSDCPTGEKCVPSTDAGDISTTNPSLDTVSLIFIGFNQLMDGASIQASSNDCTPAGGWLQAAPVAPAAPLPATESWYTCYSPQSTIPGEFSYIVLFPATTPTAASPVPVSGFSDAVALDGATTNGVYSFSGSVKDKSGTAVPIKLDATLQFPGVENLSSFTGHCSVTTTDGCDADSDCSTGETCVLGGVFLSWDPPACGVTSPTGYRIERAPNLVYSPGTYTTIVPSQTGTTFSDTTTTPATSYWYRVIPLQATAEGSLVEVEQASAK
jgi:hypothetical protein